MTTSELISFIKKQIENNISREVIISKLIGAGWRQEDIDEGFSIAQPEPNKSIPIPEIKKETINTNSIPVKTESTDKYREPLVEDNSIITKSPIIEPVKKEAPKVWTPMSVPIKGLPQKEIVGDKKEETEIILQNKELPTKQSSIPPITQKVDSVIKNPDNNTSQYNEKKEENIPKLIPKMVIRPFGTTNTDNIPKKTDEVVFIDEPQKNSLAKNLPRVAMLSSFPSELSSFKNKTQEQSSPRRANTKIIKWVIVVLVILSLFGFTAWMFTNGYINIKELKSKINFNFSFIKKDPKVLLLSNSKVLSSLNSYKTETSIEISSPSFSNISYGLLTGEAVSGLEKDSILIKALGEINKNENGALSDNTVSIKGSVLPEEIVTNIKNNGTDLFVLVPNLSQVIKENTPEQATVQINKEQFTQVTSLFKENIASQLNKINLYKILASGVPSYIDNNTLGAYNEFINNVEITEKEPENVKGIDTYHYSINTDRQLAKNLLIKISDNFFTNLSDPDKDRLNQILSSITINSFDIWIGKGDNTIYQYSAIVEIPLSKIIGFDDKSIGDNKVSISWKTTYYDFNIPNDVVMPDVSTTTTDFVKKIKETQMKNEVSTFKQLSDDFYKVKKNYGVISNTKGDCMNPITGTLFSPLGHSKGKATAVGAISLFLNKVLSTTNGVSACYSTPQAWSFAVPIFSVPEGESTTFFCVDSTGATLDLPALPTSVVCK